MPAALRRAIGAGGEAPVALLGDPRILEGRLIGFFCSVRCPGDAILKTFDIVRTLRDADVTVVGGFQSPMEREFLDLLLRGSARVVVCPARGIGRMRIPREWTAPIEKGQLLLLSFFNDSIRRATATTSAGRNAYVAELADSILIAHAEGRKNRGDCAGRPSRTENRCSRWLPMTMRTSSTSARGMWTPRIRWT